ncbi:MAG: pyridoxine 5'-phosphate synthase [Planctomycetota bacterium]
MRTLGVNIDHIASIRNLRQGCEPDPLFYALLAEQAGADSIVCHLRQDRRHINDKDLDKLKNSIHIPLNVELGLEEDVVEKVISVKPDRITLVPEYRKELTTEHGLNISSDLKKIEEITQKAQQNGIKISLFIDPQFEIIDFAREHGINIVEIHTGYFVNAQTEQEKIYELKKIVEVARYAVSNKIFVACGHGLDYRNIYPLLELKEIKEFNIGYSIIVRSVYQGFFAAVKEMKHIISIQNIKE